MKILEQTQIKQKIKRMAYQIAEENYGAELITLIGINNNGYGFAQLIHKELKKIFPGASSLNRLRLNPANPLGGYITLEKPIDKMDKHAMIIVDDVANTGRTIFYAFKPLLELIPSKIEVAVLVDRRHKSFPIKVDYMGMSLATTMKENINVDISNPSDMAVHLN